MHRESLDKVLYSVILVIPMPGNEKKVRSDILVVRKVNKNLYDKFRERALKEHRNVGDALNEAMVEWLKKQDARKKLHIEEILNLNGIVKTKKPVKWSVEVDETLYGESS